MKEMKREYTKQMEKWEKKREQLKKEIRGIKKRIEELQRKVSGKEIEKDKKKGGRGRMKNRLKKVESIGMSRAFSSRIDVSHSWIG